MTQFWTALGATLLIPTLRPIFARGIGWMSDQIGNWFPNGRVKRLLLRRWRW